MKGKIDENGNLYIERGASLKIQFCPFVTDKSYKVNDILLPVPCGDWCPLFGEPKTVALDTLYQSDKKVETALVICHGKCLVFDHFTDERVRGEGV